MGCLSARAHDQGVPRATLRGVLVRPRRASLTASERDDDGFFFIRRHRAEALPADLQRRMKKLTKSAAATAKSLTKSLGHTMDELSSSRRGVGRHDMTLANDSPWFGQPLEKQQMEMDRGFRVPSLLVALRREMDEGCALQSEGMFRLSADSRIQSLTRGRLDTGEAPEKVLEGCQESVLSGILKEYLRSLPGGAWLAGEAAAELHELLLNRSGATKQLLKQALPPLSLQVLMWTLDLILEASSYSATSKMDDNALSVVFAPLLIPAPIDAPPAEQFKMATEGPQIMRKLISDQRAAMGAKAPGAAGAAPCGSAAASRSCVPAAPPAGNDSSRGLTSGGGMPRRGSTKRKSSAASAEASVEELYVSRTMLSAGETSADGEHSRGGAAMSGRRTSQRLQMRRSGSSVGASLMSKMGLNHAEL